MVVSSFKPTSEVLAIPVNIFPKNWQIDAYTNLSNYTEYDFTRYFLNSFIVTFFAVLSSFFKSQYLYLLENLYHNFMRKLLGIDYLY